MQVTPDASVAIVPILVAGLRTVPAGQGDGCVGCVVVPNFRGWSSIDVTVRLLLVFREGRCCARAAGLLWWGNIP